MFHISWRKCCYLGIDLDSWVCEWERLRIEEIVGVVGHWHSFFDTMDNTEFLLWNSFIIIWNKHSFYLKLIDIWNPMCFWAIKAIIGTLKLFSSTRLNLKVFIMICNTPKCPQLKQRPSPLSRKIRKAFPLFSGSKAMSSQWTQPHCLCMENKIKMIRNSAWMGLKGWRLRRIARST